MQAQWKITVKLLCFNSTILKQGLTVVEYIVFTTFHLEINKFLFLKGRSSNTPWTSQTRNTAFGYLRKLSKGGSSISSRPFQMKEYFLAASTRLNYFPLQLK